MNISEHFVYLLLLSLLSGCDSTEKDWGATDSVNTIEAYEVFLQNHPASKYHNSALESIEVLRLEEAKSNRSYEGYMEFLSDYPQTTHKSEVMIQLKSVTDEFLKQSFMAVYSASKQGKDIFSSATVDHSGYDEARNLLDKILIIFPEHAVAANNRAVLAVEKGNLKKARSLLEQAISVTESAQVSDVTLQIGVDSEDNEWHSFFYLLQPVDMAIDEFSFVTEMAGQKKNNAPLTVAMTFSTPGASQLNSIKTSRCKHVIVDRAKPGYQLKREIRNNIKALKAIEDPSAREFCWEGD
ncbi:hypothetical protein MNBD_GAMMA11-3091 [hydrothermal vent metagenome]|uniref:Uncharacterized protein n=1 Tax=hydrothermal vent metagenome TaxID=652676 RepID=A0A3B0X717_9ZZZZ